MQYAIFLKMWHFKVGAFFFGKPGIRCSRDVYGTVIGVLDLKMVTNGHFSFLSESPSAMEENFDLKN